MGTESLQVASWSSEVILSRVRPNPMTRVLRREGNLHRHRCILDILSGEKLEMEMHLELEESQGLSLVTRS